MRSSFLAFLGLSFIGSVFGTNADNDDPVETAFEDLKEQLCGDRDAPFYVICVSRDKTRPLNKLEINFLLLLLRSIMAGGIASINEHDFKECIRDQINSMLEECDASSSVPNDNKESYLLGDEQFASNFNRNEKEERINEYYQKFQEIIEKYYLNNHHHCILDSPGVIIFNEYFFTGGNEVEHHIIHYRKAKSLTRKLSGIAPKMIWLCNFLTKAEYFPGFSPDAEELKQVFFQCKSDGRCVTSLTKLCKGRPEYLLTNQTFYGYNGCTIGAYKKSTYYNENDNFLESNNSVFDFGDWTITTRNTMYRGIINCFEKCFRPLICYDLKKWSS